MFRIMIENLVRRFLYYPVKIQPNAPLPKYARDAKEIWFDGLDGKKMHGLYWPAPEGRPTILFFHGNAQSVYEWALVREDLALMECGLFLIDYPGYGKSGGVPSEKSLYSAGHGALSWLVSEAGVQKYRIILFGKSLGGGVATEVAKIHRLMGMVLESTFRSIPRVAQRLLPMIPANAVLRYERYDSISRIPHIKIPLLVIHGTRDELIPVEEGKALYEAANEPKELFLVEGAGHNDVSMAAGVEYALHLRQWLDSLKEGEKD